MQVIRYLVTFSILVTHFHSSSWPRCTLRKSFY